MVAPSMNLTVPVGVPRSSDDTVAVKYSLPKVGRIERRGQLNGRGQVRAGINEHAQYPVGTDAAACTAVPHHDVGFTVTVYIRDRSQTRTSRGFIPTRAVSYRRLEGSVAVAEQHTHHSASAQVAGTGTRFATTMSGLPSPFTSATAIDTAPSPPGALGHRRLEGPVAVTQQHAYRCRTVVCH